MTADEKSKRILAQASLDGWDDAWQRAGWLGTLIEQYDLEHDWHADEDPTATAGMLRECRELHKEMCEELGERPEVNDQGTIDPEIPF